MSENDCEHLLQLSGDHGTKHTSVRYQLVQPRTPELGHGRVRNRDTTERSEDKTKEGVEQTGGLDVGRNGTNELTEGDTEQLDEDDDKKLQAIPRCTVCTISEAHGPNHEDPVDKGAENGVWNLAQKLTDGEDVGRVDPAGRLADEDTSVEDPHRLELTHDDGGKNGHPEAVESVSGYIH